MVRPRRATEAADADADATGETGGSARCQMTSTAAVAAADRCRQRNELASLRQEASDLMAVLRSAPPDLDVLPLREKLSILKQRLRVAA